MFTLTKTDYLYLLVSVNGGEYLTEEELRNKHKINSFAYKASLRKELQGKPKVEGYLGPMYGGTKDGKTVIRYETQEAHNVLSV